VVLGWYLRGAASAEEMGERLEESLRGLRVGHLMTPAPITMPGAMSTRTFIDQLPLHPAHTTFPVVGEDDALLGLVKLRDLLAVPPETRGSTRLVDVARPLSTVPTAAPNEPVLDVMRRIDGQADPRVLVLDDGHLVGILTPRDLVRAVGPRKVPQGLERSRR
jgi:CBS domain-containing protein